MEFNKVIAEEAAQRWLERQPIRDDNESKWGQAGIAGVESGERIRKRLDRLAAAVSKEQAFKSSFSLSQGISPGSPLTRLAENIGFERVIGKSDFLGMDFLELALAVSRFVCRIQIRSAPGRTVGHGTGFMVSPRLLITNNHVLGSAAEAIHSEVEFDYQYDRYGRLLPVVTYGLEPQTFFMTDRKLDFTIVAVREQSFAGVELRRYGWNRLIADEGKALHADTLNIIQHPKGEAKQIVLRSNRLVDLLENFAHYETDTEPGSSGSPVYNDQWEVVALHHSGVPRSRDGQLVTKDGAVWQEGMDPDELDWVANEGVRISSIVNFIKKQRINASMEPLRDEMLNMEPPHPFEAAALANEKPAVSQPLAAGTPAAYTFTVPLHITITVGTPQPQSSLASADTQTALPTLPLEKPSAGATTLQVLGTTTPEPVALREALHVFESARTEEYYNKQQDEAARGDYYHGLELESLSPDEVYAALRDLLKRTHKTQLTYNTARHQHLYPRVDLHPDRKLRSIYTQEVYSPETIIRQDFEIQEQVARTAREQLTAIANVNEATLAEHLAVLEALPPLMPSTWCPNPGLMRATLCARIYTTCLRAKAPVIRFEETSLILTSPISKKLSDRAVVNAKQIGLSRPTAMGSLPGQRCIFCCVIQGKSIAVARSIPLIGSPRY